MEFTTLTVVAINANTVGLSLATRGTIKADITLTTVVGPTHGRDQFTLFGTTANKGSFLVTREVAFFIRVVIRFLTVTFGRNSNCGDGEDKCQS